MTAFWRRARASSVAVASEPTLVSTPTFRSRALSYLLETVPKDRRWRVLDLGPPNQTNLEFFGKLGAHYTIEDLYRGLETYRVGLDYDPGKLASASGQLAFDKHDQFDLILSWDLFNFFPDEVLAMIARCLTPHCHDRTQLYALLSMESRVPSLPSRASIVDEKTIELDGWGTDHNRPAVQHTASKLEESMAPFGINKTYLLKLQMHEYLLEPSFTA